MRRERVQEFFLRRAVARERPHARILERHRIPPRLDVRGLLESARGRRSRRVHFDTARAKGMDPEDCGARALRERDRKSTRLNSSHQIISYAVFCLKKQDTPTA